MQMWKMRGRRRNRMWDVRLVLVLAFVTALLVAAAVFYLGWGVLGVDKVKKEKAIDASTLFDLVKLAFGVVAGAGALVALIVAYRRQRIDEDGALREHTRLHTERFTTAVTQLGDDSAAVKLGGVHALAGLADDAPTPELRQTCVDVMCAFLRLPYTAEADIPSGDEKVRHDYLALREVRHTVIRLIRDHLRLPGNDPHSWQGVDLDFTGVVFDGGDFSDAHFRNCTVSFDQATFASGRVNFEDMHMSGSRVTFSAARFIGAHVSFLGCLLKGDGTVDFHRAEFMRGTADFHEVWVTERVLLNFLGASFLGGKVSFAGVTVESATLLFDHCRFTSGQVDFTKAEFSGLISFAHASFIGGLDGPTVSMRRVVFAGGMIRFNDVYVESGVITWRDVRYGAGSVNFTGAVGQPPEGLLVSGIPLPDTVTIPAEWQPPEN
ncbi:pentapeptide repeat-containing protein [Streptomyces cellulosae]